MTEYTKIETARSIICDICECLYPDGYCPEKCDLEKCDWMEHLKEDAADVAPVVRCKDCKHLRVWNQKDIYAFCPKTNIVFLPFEKDTRTFFCSYGKRKDGDSNG